MDADDICHVDRFRMQVEAFRNSDLAVLGTWARRFGKSDTVHRDPVHHDDILASLAIASPFVNPTVMFDRNRLPNDPLLDPALRFAADYALFASLRSKARMGNLPKILLDWRLHDRNAGTAPDSKPVQRETANGIRSGIWSDSGISLTSQELAALDSLVNLPLPQLENLHLILSAFQKALDSQFPDQLWAPRPAIRRLGGEIWDYCCKVRAWSRPAAIPIWWKGRRKLNLKPTPKTLAIVIMKSLIQGSKVPSR